MMQSTELRYGFGRFTPSCLQRLHTSRWLMCVLCAQKVALAYGLFGTAASMIITIEKRFSLTYQTTTLMVIVPIVAVLLCVLPLSHFANIGHKGRWIGRLGLVVAAAQLLVVATEFIATPYYVASSGLNSSYQCVVRSRQPLPPNDDSTWKQLAFGLLVLANCISAVASAMHGRCVQLYIDENVTQTASAMYMGILALMGGFGSIIGFGFSRLWLNIHTEFLFKDVVLLDVAGSEDPRWVGAWWLGYGSAALAVTITSIPVFGFAQQLPDTARLRAKDVATVHATYRDVKQKQFTNIHVQIKELLRVPFYSLYVLNAFLVVLLFSGLFTLLPKILENFYNITIAEAGLYIGTITMPIAAATFVFGGWLLRRLKPTVMQLFRLDLLLTLAKLCFVWTWFLYCDGPVWAGVTRAYGSWAQPNNTDVTFNKSIANSCNVDCGCDEYFKPVCDPLTKTVFYSPCYAGCKVYDRRDTREEDTWSSCTCMFERAASTSVVSGLCTELCTGKLTILALALIPMTFLQTLLYAPNTQLPLRLIPSDMRMLADGFRKFVSAIAALPGQFLMGYLVDGNCLLWHQDASKNQCLRYDVHKMPYLAFTIMVTQIVLSAVINALNQLLYKPPPTQQPAAATVHYSSSTSSVPSTVSTTSSTAQLTVYPTLPIQNNAL